MAVTLKRQLTPTEKAEILERWERKCFATGHVIAEQEQVQFDHILAHAKGGASDLTNIAPMCEDHNRRKGTFALEDFRTKLRLDDFFSTGSGLTLKHLLRFLREKGDIQAFGQQVQVGVDSDLVTIENLAGQRNHYTLYNCPITGWQYFYATLPVEILDSDDEDEQQVGLQPRSLISEKVFNLYRHFQGHPVLQPAVGRLNEHRLLIFDGQHKIAALLWNGRREFECKIYLSPALQLLNDTNISAHDKFAQTRFYSMIMVEKLGALFGNDFDQYKNLEDGQPKSEAGFMAFFANGSGQNLSAGERNTRFRNYLYHSVLDDKDNKVTHLVSLGNHGSLEAPLTIDMLSKSIFMHFLYRAPVSDNMATNAYKREIEIANNVALMNILYELALHVWDPKNPNGDGQRKLSRIFGSKSIMAWAKILHDAVCAKLEVYDASEKERIFYRDLSDGQLEKVRFTVQRLVDWPGWQASAKSPIDTVLAGSRDAAQQWLNSHGLGAAYLMGVSS